MRILFCIMIIIIIFSLTLFFKLSNCVLTNDPVWVTSDYFQAGNQDVIWELTTSNVTPSYVFTFGTHFSGTPLLGYGVKGYHGGDYLGPQFFYVDRVALDATAFEVLVQIVGSTYLWILNVPYIAIDPLFPHRIVSFDNVAANYLNGDLSIFSQSQTSILTYTNTINFTQQAGSLDFNSFELPLTRNKIVLFTSSFYINGTKESNGAQPSDYIPLDLIVDAQATSTTEYQISVTYGIKATLQQLKFSEIIFDQTDIINSLKYSLEYYTIDVYKAGLFQPLPQEFIDNLIVAFTDFSTEKTKVIFHTNYEFTTVGGQFGINFPPRVASHHTAGKDSTTVDRVRYSVFYLKTWYCPNETPLFDQITQLCSQCAVPNCITCYEVHKCQVCDMDNEYGIIEATDQCELCDNTNDYFVNTATYICQACSQIGCLDCASLVKCITCDVDNEYHYDPVTQSCKTCQASYCLDCIDNNHTACQVCDEVSGYFLNDSSLHCQPCAPEGCLSCQTLNQCALCDQASDYFLNDTSLLCVSCPVSMCLDCLSIDECLVCDEASGYFLNTSSLLCEPCTVDNCVQCQTLTECAICDEGSDFFLNSTTLLCEPCQLSECTDCFSFEVCLQCNETAQFFLDPNSDLCVPCLVANCLECSSFSECAVCDEVNNYFLNITDQQCVECPVDNCVVCSSFSTCSACNESNQYFLNVTDGQCLACPALGCLDCLSFDQCNVCDEVSGYFLNDSSLHCQPCAPEGCLSCQTLNQCALCDEASDYFLNDTSLLCVSCPVSMCLDCLSIDECLVCDEASGYFLNTSSLLCEPCTVDNCVQCQTLTECAICDEGSDFFLNSTTHLCEPCQLSECTDCFSFEVCLQCNETAQFFLDPNSDLCVPCPVANCLECSSFSECAVCDEVNNYFLNITDQQCVECPVDNCVVCSSFSTCSACNESNQYFLNVTDDQCVACPASDCIECLSFDECRICNETGGYFLNNTDFTCQPCSVEGCLQCSTLYECLICNQSANYILHPDTSQCIACSLDFCLFCQSEEQCGSCDLSENYCLDSINAICIQCPKEQLVLGAQVVRSGCNNFTLSFEYNEEIFESSELEKSQRFKNAKIDSIMAIRKGNKYQISARYIEDLPSVIQYELPNAAVIEVEYTPQLPAIKYSPEECAALKNSKNAFVAIEVISYLALGFSVVANCKLVGLQLFGLLQFSFFNLADNSYWNIYLSPLTEFSHLNGYNTPLFAEDPSTIPDKINEMNLSSEFLNNCNIMLFLLFAEMLIGACLFVASKFIPKNKTLKKYSAILLKEGLVTFILFNTMNIAFSAGIHWKYSDGQSIISSVVLYSALAAIIGTAICMEVMSKKGYGEFKQKFKKQWPCFSYVPLYILYQSALGIYMSTQNQFEEGTFIIIGFCLFYGIYFLANLPFRAFYHNYRAGLILVSQFSILLITNYYRSMKSTTEMSVKARIHAPAQLQIALLFLSTGVSVIVLSYEVYLWIKAKFSTNKTDNKIQNLEDESREAIQFDEAYFDD